MNFKTKQILSIALCIILTVFSLPITVSAETGDTYKYSNAYDVKRTPAYPKSGEKESLFGFKTAITDVGGGNYDFGSTTSGDWTLTSVGMYDPNKPYAKERTVITLEELIPNITQSYNITSDKVEIFELKDGNKHICYGVICAYFDDDSLFFSGTPWDNANGAGYYIANPTYKENDNKRLTTLLDLSNMTKLKEYKAKAANRKTVNFDLNGANTSIEKQTVDKNEKATQPTEPTRDGYKFMGWYTDKEGSTKFDFNTPITENITLYAKWVKDNEDNGNIDKENKNIDNNSTELNSKQDNKDIDNNLTELNDKQDNKDINNNLTESEETVDTYSPNTGDNSNAILYISLMSISIMAFAGIIIYRKKHSIR